MPPAAQQRDGETGEAESQRLASDRDQEDDGADADQRAADHDAAHELRRRHVGDHTHQQEQRGKPGKGQNDVWHQRFNCAVRRSSSPPLRSA